MLYPCPPQLDMSHNKISLARLFASFPPVLRPKGPLGGVDGLYQLESSELELPFPVDPDPQRGALSNLLLYLQESLPTGYERLERGAVEIVGQFPVSAGGTADVWEGRIGDRRVAIKAYRCYLSSDCSLTYAVSRTYLCDVHCRLKVYQQRFYKEALTGSRLRHQNVVSSIGMYATPEYPLALVFDFMDNFDLGRYLRSNGDTGRLALVRLHCAFSPRFMISPPRG